MHIERINLCSNRYLIAVLLLDCVKIVLTRSFIIISAFFMRASARLRNQTPASTKASYIYKPKSLKDAKSAGLGPSVHVNLRSCSFIATSLILA